MEQAIYTQAAYLPPVPGGYHILYEICCRNASVINVINPLNVGSSYYAYLPPDTAYIPPPPTPIIWLEDFTLPNGTTIDNGPTAWSRTVAPLTDWAEVQNNIFESRDTDGEVVWTSEYVDISAYPGGVNLDVDLDNNGNMENADSIQVFYRLDNGGQVLFPFNGMFAGNFGATTASAICLVGDSVSIVVRMRNSANNEYYWIDDVTVRECAPLDTFIWGQNSSPTYNNFPPLFLCVVDTFYFDHSATDLDGDSLVYYMCDPTDEYSGNVNTAPPFVGNSPVIPIIPWQGGYDAGQPLGLPPLVIDPQTGMMTLTPQQLGQYVVGVCVDEYRNDTLIGTVKRDFQFNIAQCLVDPQLGFTSEPDPCDNLKINFTYTGKAVESFFWDFGVDTLFSDTSIFQDPTYTYPDTGDYTVVLIVNQAYTCADTLGITITPPNPLVADFSWIKVCPWDTVFFTDESDTNAYTGPITDWLWTYGDGSDSDYVQNPSHLYPDTITYNTTLEIGRAHV